MTMLELPEELVSRLNELGFALAEGDQPYTFVRFMLGAELRLLIQAVRADRWRVGLTSRATQEPGRLPNPFLAVRLEQFGPSPDGTTLELSAAGLRTDLLDVLEDCLLPGWDMGPG